MTHEELLDKIKSHNGFLTQENALLAVVELCKPNEDDTYKMISSLEILEAIEKALS